ncbi:MAG: hypothetical protein HYX36_11815 [Rhizobiales bacterium]|nr:hypothetical protein [Hyphomicrobiales bacterium]
MRGFLISWALSAVISVHGFLTAVPAPAGPVVLAATEAPAWFKLPAKASVQMVKYDGTYGDDRSSGNLIVDFAAAANVASFTEKLAHDGFIVAEADGFVAADPVTGRTLRLTKGSFLMGEVWRVSFIDPAPPATRFID